MRWGGCRPPGRRQDVPAYFWFKLPTERTATMSIDTMIGVDLAKSVFQVHGASMNGEIQFQRKLSRQRSEEHTSELQSLMRISYAVFCLKKKNNNKHNKHENKQITLHSEVSYYYNKIDTQSKQTK